MAIRTQFSIRMNAVVVVFGRRSRFVLLTEFGRSQLALVKCELKWKI